MEIFCNVVGQLSAERQNDAIRLLKVIYLHHCLQKHKILKLIINSASDNCSTDTVLGIKNLSNCKAINLYFVR